MMMKMIYISCYDSCLEVSVIFVGIINVLELCEDLLAWNADDDDLKFLHESHCWLYLLL